MNRRLQVTIISALLMCATVARAGTVSFSPLPGDGHIDAAPGSTVGWGYEIQNATTRFLLPLGLTNTGVIYGSLSDIFDYPVVYPGQTISQSYAFNAPGGFGNSFGLFEYTVPSDVPPGLIQSGQFLLSYQLYDANPDLNAAANPVGDPNTLAANFDVVAAAVAPAADATPESSTAFLLAVGLGLLIGYPFQTPGTAVSKSSRPAGQS